MLFFLGGRWKKSGEPQKGNSMQMLAEHRDGTMNCVAVKHHCCACFTLNLISHAIIWEVGSIKNALLPVFLLLAASWGPSKKNKHGGQSVSEKRFMPSKLA